MSHEKEARDMMFRARFNTEKIRLATIWASKWTRCSKCSSPIGKPCMNLNERARGRVKETLHPHKERIDWEMLVENLKARGYK